MADANIKLSISAIEKLLDYVASGIGAVAGPMLASWKARQEMKAELITAKGEAEKLQIMAEAQFEARQALVKDSPFTGNLIISDTMQQRIQFQEEKKQRNIVSVIEKAAQQLGDKEVPDIEPDHDWTARFFNEAQDISSEEMQSLWAKVLSGEVEREGSTSIRTLGILKNLDKKTAQTFSNLCSACTFLIPDGRTIRDARIPSLGGSPGANCLKKYGFTFDVFNILNESGLIIPEYDSSCDYKVSIGIHLDKFGLARMPFRFQNRYWVLSPPNNYNYDEKFKMSGVALNQSGRELSRVVDVKPMDDFFHGLQNFFKKNNLQMIEVDSLQPKMGKI